MYPAELEIRRAEFDMNLFTEIYFWNTKPIYLDSFP